MINADFSVQSLNVGAAFPARLHCFRYRGAANQDALIGSRGVLPVPAVKARRHLAHEAAHILLDQPMQLEPRLK
jgi:hypothetical protein